MDGRKILLLVFIALISAGTVLAYTGTGSSDDTPTTKCNDGVDNDRDTKTDGNDAGCIQPYYLDDSEENIFDLDAATVFSDLKPTDSVAEIKNKLKQGPSAYYGWKVTRTGISPPEWGDEVVTQSGTKHLNVTWVNGSREEYRGGNLNWTLIGLGDFTATTDRNSPYAGLIDSPAPNTNDMCGDGIEQSGEDTLNCPEDAGLPSQQGRADGTISDDLGKYSISGDDGNNHKDEVMYDVGSKGGDLRVSEYTTEGDNCGLSNTECDNIQGLSSDPSKLYQTSAWKNVPDFIVRDGGTEIYAVYPTLSQDDVGEVSNDVLKSSKSVDHYTSTGTKKSFDCTGMGCVAGNSYCTSTTDKSKTDYDLESKSTTIGYSSQEYTTSTSGGLDYTVDTSSTPMAVKVTYDDATSSQVSYNSCSNFQIASKCSTTGDCTLSNDKTTYSKGSKSYNPGYNTGTKDYNIESVSFTEEKIFDLSPDGNPHPLLVKAALFNNNFDVSDVVQRSFNNNGWFSYEVPNDGRDQGNDYSVSLSRFSMTIDGSNNFISQREESHTYSADGQNGTGDGFIAIDEGSIAGSSNRFMERELSDESSGSFVSQSDLGSFSCPGDDIKCVASVDVNLTSFDQWNSVDPAGEVEYHITDKGPYGVKESFGTCKMYQNLYDNDPSTTDSDLKCTPEYNIKGPEETGDPPEPCGDQAGEYHILMEGPEVNESVMEENGSYAYKKCIDTKKNGVTKSSCNLKGETVPEGYVADVAPPSYDTAMFEAGGNSPDAEVCLDLEGTGISDEGDEVAGDNKEDDLSQEDYGGEWYDIDSEVAQRYLRDVRDGSHTTLSGRDLVSDSGTEDSNGDGNYNSKDIDWYWRENPNPSHSKYNPEGGSYGISLESDCGNTDFSSDNIRGCNDAEERPLNGDVRQPTFYSFFEEGKRDEDYHPQGEDTSVDNEVFTGYINNLSDMSNQLESGMDTTNYYTPSTSNPVTWNNSDGSQDAADQWAITQTLNWSISSRGVPYPPWGTYYREASDKRSGPGSDSPSKEQKVFGNSYAAVANKSMTDDNGNTVDPGDGVWIDPDYIRNAWNSDNYRWSSSTFSWKDTIAFNMDITGPDSGIGFDTGDGSGIEFKGSSGKQKAVVYGDIYFQGEKDDLDNDGDGTKDEGPTSQTWEGTDQVGETVTQHEPPICGDDQKEFLLEEMGESKRSSQYDGMYACTNTSDPCVDMSSTPRIVEKGSASQANEPDENVGRLKNDVEICEQRPEDDTSLWYDQDYGDIDGDGSQDTCRTNDIYGNRGVRWVNSSYVQNYPHAVKGGIDDDWNQYIEDNYDTGNSDEYKNRYKSRPDKDSWSFGSESPVPSGSRAVGNDSIATLGFCGGDDEGEYLVTQQCQTNLCETNRSVQGVTKVSGGCVLGPSTLSSGYSANTTERKIYEPGDRVEIDLGSGSRDIACFDSTWYEDGPIIFNQNNIEVPFGDSAIASFQVINVQKKRITFEVEMIDPLTNPSAYQFSTFVKKSGDSFETSVEPQSTKTFYVEIQGSNKAIGDDSKPSEDDLEIRADALGSDLSGEDHTTVEVVENNATNSTLGRSEPKSVPGIGPIHIIALIMTSSAIFFLQS